MNFWTDLDLRQAWLGLSVQHMNISIYSLITQNPELEYTHKWSHKIFLVAKKKKMKWSEKTHIHQIYALPLLSARRIPSIAKAWA